MWLSRMSNLTWLCALMSQEVTQNERSSKNIWKCDFFSSSRFLETYRVMPKADLIRFMHGILWINKAVLLLFPGGFLHIKLYFCSWCIFFLKFIMVGYQIPSVLHLEFCYLMALWKFQYHLFKLCLLKIERNCFIWSIFSSLSCKPMHSYKGSCLGILSCYLNILLGLLILGIHVIFPHVVPIVNSCINSGKSHV